MTQLTAGKMKPPSLPAPLNVPVSLLKAPASPRFNSNRHSCTSQKEYSRTKIFTTEHNVISVSLFCLTHYDKETSQIFRMALYHAAGGGKVIK